MNHFNIFQTKRNTVQYACYFTYFMFSSRLESGFRVVECFTILYIVITRKMRLSCQNRIMAVLIHEDLCFKIMQTEEKKLLICL